MREDTLVGRDVDPLFGPFFIKSCKAYTLHSIWSACSRRAHAVGRRVSLGPQLTPQTPIRSALPRMREVLRKEEAWSTRVHERSKRNYGISKRSLQPPATSNTQPRSAPPRKACKKRKRSSRRARFRPSTWKQSAKGS